MVRRSSSSVLLRGPVALFAILVVVAGIGWSITYSWTRVQQRRQIPLMYVAAQAPALAVQLAVAEQRLHTRTGRFTADVDALIESWAAQLDDERLGDAVRSQAARHRIEATAAAGGYTVTVHVFPDGAGGSYSLAVDTDRQIVTKTCNDAATSCHGGMWSTPTDDRYFLQP